MLKRDIGTHPNNGGDAPRAGEGRLGHVNRHDLLAIMQGRRIREPACATSDLDNRAYPGPTQRGVEIGIGQDRIHPCLRGGGFVGGFIVERQVLIEASHSRPNVGLESTGGCQRLAHADTPRTAS